MIKEVPMHQPIRRAVLFCLTAVSLALAGCATP